MFSPNQFGIFSGSNNGSKKLFPQSDFRWKGTGRDLTSVQMVVLYIAAVPMGCCTSTISTVGICSELFQSRMLHAWPQNVTPCFPPLQQYQTGMEASIFVDEFNTKIILNLLSRHQCYQVKIDEFSEILCQKRFLSFI